MSELNGLKLLRRIDEGVAGKTGDAFFRQIVCDLAGALDAHGAFTSRLLPDRRAGMLAFWVGGRFEKCNEYSLAGTPCEYVYNGQITSYARNVGEVFPVDKEWFELLGVKSYLGIPVKDDADLVCGHLAVMDTRERDWHEVDIDILRLFSLRSAAELERVRYQQQLAAAKNDAETANRAKSIFISQMSHELRTPLNGILGYTQLLKQDSATLAPRQIEGLNVIERSGEHLLNLVNDLLDLAKIEAGKLELACGDVNLLELLGHVVDLARVRAEHAGLTFSFHAPTKLPSHVSADARALRQVLLNLLGNAVKFTQAGGCVTLQVTSREFVGGRHEVTFSIVDTGVGIPTEQLTRIFEPFHRVTDAGRFVEGTGLGLSITRRLVEEMGGTLDVKSVVGGGSTFTVSLQLDAAQPQQSEVNAVSQINGYEGRRRNVIVADDDEVNRSLVSQLLESLGFNVCRATNGLEALQLFRSAVPDLVITDLVMPVVDGIEFTRTIRGVTGASAVPVIALSASASQYTRQEALQAGCSTFVSKPMRFADLLEEIGQLLDLQWLRSAEQPEGKLDATVAHPALGGPDPQTANELYHFALQGDVLSLLSRARETMASDPKVQPLYSKICSLAEQYDMGALRRILDQQRLTQ